MFKPHQVAANTSVTVTCVQANTDIEKGSDINVPPIHCHKSIQPMWVYDVTKLF